MKRPFSDKRIFGPLSAFRQDGFFDQTNPTVTKLDVFVDRQSAEPTRFEVIDAYKDARGELVGDPKPEQSGRGGDFSFIISEPIGTTQTFDRSYLDGVLDEMSDKTDISRDNLMWQIEVVTQSG